MQNEWFSGLSYGYLPPNYRPPPSPSTNRPIVPQRKKLVVELGKVGLGLRLSKDLKILEITAGGPCSETCLRCGDYLVDIDGYSVIGKKPQDIVGFTLGDEGSSAAVEHSADSGETLTAKVIRKFVAVKSLDEIIKEQIDLGFRRRDPACILEAFNKHGVADQDGKITHITVDSFLHALKEFDSAPSVCADDLNTVDFVFKSLDRNGDGTLDFDEFTRAVQTPFPVEEWASALPLPQLLVDALPRREGSDRLRAVGRLTDQEITAVVAGFAHGLQRILKDHVSRLHASFDKMDEAAKQPENPSARKFRVDTSNLKLRCGRIDDYHKGVLARIGHAYLNFVKAMEAEHRHGPTATEPFETINYRIKTCPKREWEIVVERAECTPAELGYNRRIPDIEKLLRLELSDDAGLTRPEIIAVVLYSGPMFHVYNTILRQYPENLYQVYKSANNLFTTTIHVLISALQKISRVTNMDPDQPLYRGLGWDADLPELFHERDAHGCSGFTEWGFMSTTSRKDVAVQYSKVQEGNPLPRVLVIKVGSVDRGACIKDFSQYEEEIEYLYVPCSFIEKTGPQEVEVTQSGVVEMIPVRVNANLKTRTVEELLDQKKDMHLAAFDYLIHEIDEALHRIADEQNAEDRLLNDESRDESHSVHGFIARIVDQCKDVRSKHRAIVSSEYVSERTFRKIVLEMIDVKIMAMSKLLEWLENKESSFIRFRWGSPLRTAHRRWIAFLEKTHASCPAHEKEGSALRLCKVIGLIVESVDERDAEGETSLMRCAAEGRAKSFLRILVEAQADPNAVRADGVTAMWLAAQFGRDSCIKSLAKLKGSVSQAANDGATPIYIAAQQGFDGCIRALVDRDADVKCADKKGVTPLHQAAMNGHTACVELLVERRGDLQARTLKGETPLEMANANKHAKCVVCVTQLMEGACHDKTLIISTGDISDVDGFFALAEYAKTGADVIFIMNYPAYIGVKESDLDSERRASYADQNPGLGYKYSAKQVFDREASSASIEYLNFTKQYRESEGELVDDNIAMKSALTDLAYELAYRIWNEGPEDRGMLYFCVGGINAVNPFSDTAIKNEVLVYSALITGPAKKLSTTEGLIYDCEGKTCEVDFAMYSKIYIDFNGSFSFWNEVWNLKLSEVSSNSQIKGVFIMGGVLTDSLPVTMPSIPKVLNRFSSATMNQLYHPQKTAEFFLFVEQYKIPAFVVTNNAVGDITTFADDQKQKTMVGVDRFLESNQLTGDYLKKLASLHYNSKYNPPRKPFDYYVAFALKAHLESGDGHNFAGMQFSCGMSKTLFYSNVYGTTFVCSNPDWVSARSEYMGNIAKPMNSQDAFAKTKWEYFQKEIVIMNQQDRMGSLPVIDLRFNLDAESKKLSLDKDSILRANTLTPERQIVKLGGSFSGKVDVRVGYIGLTRSSHM